MRDGRHAETDGTIEVESATLTPAQRERVARLHAEGVNMTAIAVRCGVSIATISRVIEKQKPAKSA